jgi:hypothetical protein
MSRKKRQRSQTRQQRAAARQQREAAAAELLAEVGPAEVQRRHDALMIDSFCAGEGLAKASESPVILADLFTDDMVDDFEAVLKRQFKRLTGKELTAETAEEAQEDAAEAAETQREIDWVKARYSDEEPPDTTTQDYGPPFAPDGAATPR